MKKKPDPRLMTMKKFQSIDRKPMPRPTVFKDKTKYNRKSLKKVKDNDDK